MKRLIAALKYSLAGLRHGFQHETPIREELLLLFASLIVVPILTLDPWRMVLLWGSIFLILIVELLNTGIEQLANRISQEHSAEIKFAKDCGSAAVLFACILAAAVWGIAVWEWWST